MRFKCVPILMASCSSAAIIPLLTRSQSDGPALLLQAGQSESEIARALADQGQLIVLPAQGRVKQAIEMPFPVQALAAFVQSPRFQKFDVWLSEGGEYWLLTMARNPRLRGSGSDLYQFQVGRYYVLVVTPILQWYLDERDTIQVKRKAAKRQKKVWDASDAGQLQWDWSRYEDRIQSVVHILTIPDFCQTTASWLLSGITKKVTQLKYKTSSSEMSLLCDGEEIQPIDRRDFQVEIPKGYGTTYGAVASAGAYQYSFDAFRKRCGKLKLKIILEGNDTDARVIPGKILRQVWTDFEGY